MQYLAALLGLPVLFFLPGHLASAIAFRSLRPGRRVPLAEGLFGAVTLSLLVTTAAAHGLGEAGVYSARNLYLVVGGFSALLLGVARLTRSPLLPYSLAGGALRNGAPFLLLGVLAWLYLPPSQYLWGDADEGTYMNASVRLARKGSFWFTDPLLAELPPDLKLAHSGLFISGFYIADMEQRGPITPHGFHFMPAYLAAMQACGGLKMGFRGPTLLLLVSIWGLYLLTARFAGAGPGLLVAGLLGLNPLSVWFSRLPFGEVQAETLLVSGFALLALGFPREGERPPLAASRFRLLLGGLLLGSIHIAKIEFFALPAVVLAFAFVLWALGRLDRRTWPFFAGYLVNAALGAFFALTSHSVYFMAQLGNTEIFGKRNARIFAGFFVALAVLVLVVWRARARIRARVLRLPAARLLTAAGALTLLAAAWLYFVLPAQSAWGERPVAELNALQRALAVPPEMIPEHPELRSWREITLPALGLYLTGVGVFLGFLGTFLLLRRRDFLPAAPFLVFALAQTAFFLVISGWIDYGAAHFHSPGRRFLNITAAAFLFAGLVPFFTARRARPLWAALGLLVAAWLGTGYFRASSPFFRYRPWPDTLWAIRDVARHVPANAVLIASLNDPLAGRYLSPLHFLEDRSIFLMNAGASTDAVLGLIEHVERRGRLPVFVTGREPDATTTPAERLLRERLDPRGQVILDRQETTVAGQRRRLPDETDRIVWGHRLVLHGVSPP
jgi:hypothetical protein